MKKQLIIILAIGVVITLMTGFTSKETIVPKESASYELTTLAVGSTTVRAQIARTDEDRAQGLSGRVSLGENEGMLFVFDLPGQYGFWMKDMNFPIDIIWIDSSNTIVDIHKKVLPDSYPTLFSPKEPAQYVLEVNAGWTDEHAVKVGDIVTEVDSQ